MAGVLAHSRELTVFTNPLPNSYQRFGCDEAPRYVSWSRQNRSQLVRIPHGEGRQLPHGAAQPGPRLQPLSGHRPGAGCRIWTASRHRMVLSAAGQQEPVPTPARPRALGWRLLPATLEEAVQASPREATFCTRCCPRS